MLPRGLSLRGRRRMRRDHGSCGGSKKRRPLAGALCGFTVEVPELLGGVTGEIGELELGTI